MRALERLLMAYETTTVDVPKSQSAIRNQLLKAGADRVAFAEQLTGPDQSAGVEFLHRGLLVRVVCPIPTAPGKWLDDKVMKQRSGTKDRVDFARDWTAQESKRIWRVLHWSIKARMEAVDEGLETFEQAFLPHLVDPSTNRTLWDHLRPGIEGGAMCEGGGGLLAIEAGG
jgi:hypothetical protein